MNTTRHEPSSSSNKGISNKLPNSSLLPLSYDDLVSLIPESPIKYEATIKNTLCGDEARFDAWVLGERIISLTFSGFGCVLVKEQGKRLCQVLAGKTVEEALSFRFEPDFEITRPDCFNLPYKCLEKCFEGSRSDNSREHY